MRIYVNAMILITWATNMVKSQGYMDPDIDTCTDCEHKYTVRGARKGIFTSPGFPENYPERTTCCYFFHAKDDGRVRIEFDYFDLEASDHECRYDYIEISSINAHGYKEQPKALYCGTSTPPEYISTHSKLEVVFHSDVTTNAKGFLGHYEFLDKNWHPFPPSTIGCGPGYLTGPGGSITSPRYPDAYPAEAGCTWIIQVEQHQRVLLNILSLDITNTGKCQDTNLLMIFDGFITKNKDPVKYCGQLAHEAEDRREFLSQGERVVIRFQSGTANGGGYKGFHIVWSAVTLEHSGDCGGFECARVGTERCDRSLGQHLCKDQHYCIDITLKCNDVPNCGVSDRSDENKCLNYILRYVGIVGGSALVVVVVIIVVVVCCYRKRCRRQHIKYSVPREQSLAHSMTHSFMSTQSSNLPVTSLEHSPRSSCVMYTTSFTDCALSDHVTSPNHKDKNNTNLNSFSHSNSFHLPDSVTDNTKHDATGETDVSTETYKGHQKRPSYHMMRELCYEDGNIVLADI